MAQNLDFPYPFTPASHDGPLRQITAVTPPTDSAGPAGSPAEAGGSQQPCGHVLPVSAYKWCPERIAFQGEAVSREFLSSGTTGALRSRSAFSEAGLKAYRDAAVAHFSEVLQAVTGLSAAEVWSVQLISMVPQTQSTEGEQWPSSSLAYMVAAFGAHWPLHYTTPKQLEGCYRKLHQEQPKPAIVILATALHWLELMNQGLGFALSQRTWLLETGGTKGQHQSITREHFYQRLCGSMAIKDQQIISEYGSCELAAQAYDYRPYCPSEQQAPRTKEPTADRSSDRRFAFAPTVTVYVAIESSEQLHLAKEGVGTLVLFDPKRIDTPYLIETEDRVDLSGDGRFRLLGRVQTAPLKGCSLLGESLPMLSGAGSATSVAQPPSAPGRGPVKPLGARIDALRSMWRRLLADDGFAQALLADLKQLRGADLAQKGLEKVHSALLADLTASFLAAKEDYLGAIAQITGKTCPEAAFDELNSRQGQDRSGREGEHWLIVLPSSHPIAGFYPLTLAAALGLRVTIRPSSRQSFAVLARFLEGLREVLQEDSSVRMKVVASDAEFNHALDTAQGVLVFGQDKTVELFRQRLPQAVVRGFGDAVAGTVVAGPPDAVPLSLVCKDVVSLAGLGCLSSRFVAVVSPDRQGYLDWCQALAAALKDYGPCPSVFDKSLQPPAKSLQRSGKSFQRSGKSPQRSGKSLQPTTKSHRRLGRAALVPLYLLDFAVVQPNGLSGGGLDWQPWQVVAPRDHKNQTAESPLLLPPDQEWLPVWWLKSANDIGHVIENQGMAKLRRLSASASILAHQRAMSSTTHKSLEWQPLGQLNSNPMTGRHLGELLF